MPITIGILVFDGVDELDFVGPLNVFSYATGWGQNGRVLTVGARRTAFQGVNGLSFMAGYDFSDCPPIDVVVVPGGQGVDELLADEAVLEWVTRIAASAKWICSVCTGAFVLQAAGLTEGRRITTHSGMTDRLKAASKGEVVEGERFVADGNIVTAAGVSAGIDMSLWVVGQIYGEDHARTVQANLEYKPMPPY
jgi:transcriptional regulator GlxA family with amidase domain